MTAADSAGITGAGMAAAMLPLAAIAPHPANPREDLGDLDELRASIAELGVLEPLVVATLAAHQAGGWPGAGASASATHVVLAGHRRRAAAAAAGLDAVPCVVRDDLAGADALVVMLAENDPAKRHGLTPLAEARAFAQLAGRGWGQRKIAERMGCKQPHVSKRLALLKLPDEARKALAAGKITAADGAELAKLAGHPDRAAKAAREISENSWSSAGSVVARHLSQIEREARAAATRAQLEAEGIRAVDPGVLGPYAYSMRLPAGTDLAPHRDAGCLVGAAASHSGERELYCRDPAAHEGTAAAVPAWAGSYAAGRAGKDADRAEEERQRAAAARARKAAAGQLAARPVSAARAAELVSLALIARHADAQCLETAVKWLRAAGLGPAEGDHYGYAAHVTGGGDQVAIRRLAHAMALAADERAAASAGDYSAPWDGRQVAYLERLAGEAGYQPGEWEQARLDQARARIRARAELACPDCGCRYDHRCKDGYARCDAEPAGDGTWRYRCHGTHAPASASGGDGGAGDEAAENLWEALEDLLAATDPGHDLPAALEEAISDAAAELGSRWDDQAGDASPSAGIIAAARILRDAAMPHQADWTPQLRDAIARLGEHAGPPAGAGAHAGPAPAAEDGTDDDPWDDDAREDLWEALEDLLCAVDPSTAAGSALPDELAAAIEAERTRLAELWEDQPGNESPGLLVAAARDLRAAAAAAGPLPRPLSDALSGLDQIEERWAARARRKASERTGRHAER